jgi:hypothetical protein
MENKLRVNVVETFFKVHLVVVKGTQINNQPLETIIVAS